MQQIPVYDLPEEQTQCLDFKLYHLKGDANTIEKQPFIPIETRIPHRHKFYEICIFASTGGIHEIDFQAFEIKERSIHFLSPGQVHLLSGTQKNQGFVLAFSPEFMVDSTWYDSSLLEIPFFNPLKTDRILELSEKDYAYVITLLQHIASDYAIMGEKAKEIIQHYVKILLGKCNYLFTEKQKSTVNHEDTSIKLISRFKYLVEQHFHHIHQVQQYSELLYITPAHLNKCCKQITGVTASELIMQRIVLEARRLLMFTGMSSKEVAFHLQFEDPAYFSRIFKKKSGYSPTAFRATMHEKYQQ
jgi:AraC family transcriptional activator of pobA